MRRGLKIEIQYELRKYNGMRRKKEKERGRKRSTLYASEVKIGLAGKKDAKMLKKKLKEKNRGE